MSFSIHVHGLDEIERRFAVPLEATLAPAWLAIGEEARNIIASYPSKPGYPLKWQSDKQRRFYFAMRDGDLPYVRGSDGMSQRLGPSWAVTPIPFGAVVGTRVAYAPYVQADEMQQDMHHATGWPTDKQTAQRLDDSKIPEQIIWRTIAVALGG